MPVTQDLERLDAEYEVGAAGGHDVGKDLRIAVAEVGLDPAAALRHPVDLGLFEMKARVESGVVDDERDGEDALATDACNDDVLLHDRPLTPAGL